MNSEKSPRLLNLEYVFPEIEFFDEMAIVGSSAKLLDSNLGEMIDKFEEVVRFNRAPTEGFEDDVGSRTTLRVANNHVFDNVDISNWAPGQPKDFIRNLKETCIMLLGPDAGPWHRRDTNIHKTSQACFFDYTKMQELKNIIGFEGSKNLSVGLAFIAICIATDIKPVVFGFDVDEDAERSHYWEPIGPSGNVHNKNEEKKVLMKLAEDGKIFLHR